MRHTEVINVALVGNPNTGKSLLFNQLTGLNQKVSNYPGVTVEKKTGSTRLNDETRANITDLPGTYSINPSSLDENIVLQTFLSIDKKSYPDVVVVVADVENLKRNLFLFSQIKDLEIPAILAINMSDRMKKNGISIDVELLKEELKSEVILISARKNLGIDKVKEAILNYKNDTTLKIADIADRIDAEFFRKLEKDFNDTSLYKAWLLITQNHNLISIPKKLKERIDNFKADPVKLTKMQNKETILRYQYINNILKKTYTTDAEKATGLRHKIDKILTHKVFGYLIFAFILLLIFQSIFDWATLPMDLIDSTFANLSEWTKTKLPDGVFTNLLAEGIIPGIGGIVIFIPQIAILFLFIAILEETGYMSRVVFLMDKIMRRFGMSGKSVVPLVSGTACAIPAIMAARNIEGWKERLVTILVTPFTTCSARLPVYAILIALIIPQQRVLGIFSLQGLALMSLYLLGFAAAIVSGWVLNKTLKVRGKSFFVIEMPAYKIPSLKNVIFTVIEKTKAFVFGAGKIILAISIILWFLASNGPASFKNAEETVKNEIANQSIGQDELDKKIATYKLENSYIGIAGKAIEPAIKPLGYDWKIGIALLTSFAAREVFVSTLATIYSVEDDENTNTIKQRMDAEINPETGDKRFNFPVGMSLLVFYAFAMQCASTLAIVKRETNSWKWPLLQLFGMTALAYVASFITFTMLS
ncbi:ferrous iron transport protein B [Aureibaculum sp. 2210JD6-5]|uniref:ferrous iron transport protein B n=1 Tax=Aureibaculum sp. 2210JD6-5 TaxID=3103957 RepID=UPI002AAE5125|nr:ferrous iron transport protein B [Aureibaculum sp. 2210JD6-5]MDY7395745.1 ferrous iron transport protein B [Aureibaculum sp. 2210JD6-5]